jgi:hypothetical protein
MLQRRSTQEFRCGVRPAGRSGLGSHGRIVLPFLVFVPLVVTALVLAYRGEQIRWELAVPLFALGWLLWTLYEYVHHSIHSYKWRIGWTNARRKRNLRYYFTNGTR